MNLSKTRYCSYILCPKACWLKLRKPELCGGVSSAAREGTRVGELARGLFGAYTDVTAVDENGELNLSAMILKTRELIKAGVETICEAAFDYDGCYCAVDVLHREKGGYAIYEVKSTTRVYKEKHCPDVAYQKYVLERCGVRVTGTYLVHINNQYVLHGELELNRFFTAEDISEDILPYETDLEQTIARAKTELDSGEEPEVRLEKKCENCDFWEYCARDIPKPSVFDLYSFADKWKCFDKGIVTYEELVRSGYALKERQKLQVEHTLHDLKPHVKKAELQKFLSGLSYPLYFLDFETMQVVIPDIEGTHPYQAIPFQYSLHIVDCEDAVARHISYLAEPEGDPRRALAEQLLKDIPQDVCILAYCSGVESGIIRKLAEQFSDLKTPLERIAGNIKNLEEPFNQHKNYYYCRAMGRYSTIKVVSPALYPDDPGMDYQNLEGIHNGTQAMEVFPQMKYMSPEEREKTRRELIEYCGLDTRAMVKLWQELLRVSK